MIRQALAKQLAFTRRVIEMNLAGMTQEQSLRRPAQGGSSPNWVLGHILGARVTLHELLGLRPEWDAASAASYARGSTPPDAAAALPLERMLDDLGRSQAAVLPALEAVDDARLAEDAGAPSDSPLAGCSRAEALAAMVFHEAYHAGQLGVLRHAAGLDGALG
ncbi:MAG: DinB family protein [Planctomycetes bacterium]|nr:DinB family protein [Planctomycetota bacterium]